VNSSRPCFQAREVPRTSLQRADSFERAVVGLLKAGRADAVENQVGGSGVGDSLPGSGRDHDYIAGAEVVGGEVADLDPAVAFRDDERSIECSSTCHAVVIPGSTRALAIESASSAAVLWVSRMWHRSGVRNSFVKSCFQTAAESGMYVSASSRSEWILHGAVLRGVGVRGSEERVSPKSRGRKKTLNRRDRGGIAEDAEKWAEEFLGKSCRAKTAAAAHARALVPTWFVKPASAVPL